MVAVRPMARLTGCARVLGLEASKTQYGLRPSALEHSTPSSSLTLAHPATGILLISDDLLLLTLDLLEADEDKVALACACRSLLKEQRRLRPLTSHRARTTLSLLSAAWSAGWRVAHCHVDKLSGSWGPPGEEKAPLTELESLSIVGRPDCALLVLSPFTDLALMTKVRVFEVYNCAIGDAGVHVLAAAFRKHAMPALRVLDLRRNRTPPSLYAQPRSLSSPFAPAARV